MRNIWKIDGDPTRCDYPLRWQPVVATQLSDSSPLPQEVPLIITEPVVATAEPFVATVEPVVATAVSVVATAVPVAVTARRAPNIHLNDLAQRSPTTTEDYRQAYTITTYSIPLDTRPKDMRLMQFQYNSCLSSMYNSCCSQFWEIFLNVHSFPVNVIDTVLRTAKRTFLVKATADWKQFPSSRRKFLEKAGCANDFWTTVKHTCQIDVTGILRRPLASGTQSVTFEFLDPVWAWLSVAKRLPPEELHWRPIAQNFLDPVYGGGMQYGQCFRQACASCPPGGYPMCIGLHWDGTSGGGISSEPICIGVMNTNNCGAETQCCIGYIPKVPDSARAEFAKTADCTKIKFHIRQECCRAILRVLENAATKGVICGLNNRLQENVSRLLFPRLTSMNFDQPEAQLFFGEY